MKVLLRARKTGLYYRGPREFTPEPSQALEFSSIAAGARLALAARLPDVDIALTSESPGCEVLLPVLPMWCETDQNQPQTTGKP